MMLKNKFNGYSADGRRLYPGGDGGGQPSQPEKTTVTQTSIPEYARPYVERMLGKTEALTGTPYQAYGGERLAGFTPLQQQAFTGVANLQPSQQLGVATQMAGLAGLRAAGLNYDPSTFSSFTNQYRAPGAYQAGTFSTQNVNAPQLQQFQMGPYERVEGQEAFSADAAKQYMNPYMQNVVDIQKREAQRQADIAAGQRAGQAAQAGAFGGSRMGLQSAMADRETQRLMQDIQATGSSSAYQQALGQFNLEQQARRQAELANQAAGLTTGQANLQALLGVQQLGAGQSMQAQLANQQALMQAQQAAEQSRQFGYGQGMTAAEAAARYGLEAQRGTLAAQQAAEQSRQFGAGYGLQGIQQQLAAAGQLGQLGQTQFGQQKDILQGQLAAGAQQRDLEQQRLTQAYQDFQAQRQYPYQQLAYMSDMLRGLPLAQYSQTMYAQPASPYAQLAGAGMTYLGAKQAGLFGAEGGVVPSGLARVAADKLMQE